MSIYHFPNPPTDLRPPHVEISMDNPTTIHMSTNYVKSKVFYNKKMWLFLVFRIIQIVINLGPISISYKYIKVFKTMIILI